MISDNQTDAFFNERLQNYPSAVPSDMWNRIIEKKKRDRLIWLFFLRLFGLVILSLILAGGYFIFNQKNSASVIRMDSTKINHTSIFTDTVKASSSNLPSGKDQIQVPQINTVNKKTNQKEKTQISHIEKFDHAKTNTQNNEASTKIENTSKNQPVLRDSSTLTDSSIVKVNETVHKNDSLGKKPFIKVTTTDSTKLKDVKKPVAEKKLNDRKWYLDLYASPDYPITHEYGQSKLSYTLGVRINRSLGKHFSIKTGIQYSQVNIGGVDSNSFGTIIHLMRLDLPILAGYSVGDEKLRTTFNGGVMLNLYTWLRGNYTPDFFKTNTGFSLYLGVNFETKINEKFSLFGEPYYRYQLTSMTVSSVSIMKFIDIVGINIGARYYFGNKHSGR
ncbi:MAG TPA: hypothetical protein VGZ90_15395 [Puia sp.]|jgi:hypothetical protein|nr:hypothetical protein [Puia sp.]